MKIISSLKKNNGLSRAVVAIIFFAWMVILFNNKFYTRNAIEADVTYYYSYLPAIFIYKDIEFGYSHHNPFLADKLWPEKAPNGKEVSKTTMGLAILWLPFFLIGHVAAHVLNYPPNGYAPPYYFFLFLGVFFYLGIGIIYLRKVLLLYFTDAVTSLTLLSVFFGTNLMYYSTLEPLMPHVFMFTFISLVLYMTHKWHKEPTVINSVIFGLVSGLLVLIRPTHLLILLIPLFYGIYDKESWRNKITFLRKNIFKIGIIVISMIVVYSPQLWYWKTVTGGWMYYSYGAERFYFLNPHLIDGLFSYRKGWFVYTPIMIFSIIGFFFLKKRSPSLFYPLLVVFLVAVYVTLSWWCWWYGGSYGLRAFVDYYGLLALPMAAFYQACLKSGKVIKLSFLSLVFVLISLSCFQTYQKKNGIIHYDGMTKEVYWMVFGKVHMPHEFWNKLKQPDYEKARAGLPAD